MNDHVETAAVYEFGNITAVEKVLWQEGIPWRYTVSGVGDQFILAIISNTTGHLLALPLAEEFRDSHKTIALSISAVGSFAQTARGLKGLLENEKVNSCHMIGHSNGGVYLQNLIKEYPESADKIVFSHSLTSMDKNDAYSINASEVKVYQMMRKMLKVLPASVLSFAMGKIVLSKLVLKSGHEDTKRLVKLCKEDLKRVTKQDFPSGGHVTLVTCREEYFSLLREFWLNKMVRGYS